MESWAIDWCSFEGTSRWHAKRVAQIGEDKQFAIDEEEELMLCSNHTLLDSFLDCLVSKVDVERQSMKNENSNCQMHQEDRLERGTGKSRKRSPPKSVPVRMARLHPFC
jgi:hypothetical protein